MAKVKDGDTVKVHYTGKLDDNTIFDSSENKDPLEFTIGKGQIIPGFEQAVIGMDIGQLKTEKIPAEKAYGPYRDEMVMAVSREQIPSDVELEIDKQLQVKQADGQTMIVKIKEITDSNVTLDANHPLAGKDLTFDIELKEVV